MYAFFKLAVIIEARGNVDVVGVQGCGEVKFLVKDICIFYLVCFNPYLLVVITPLSMYNISFDNVFADVEHEALV